MSNGTIEGIAELMEPNKRSLMVCADRDAEVSFIPANGGAMFSGSPGGEITVLPVGIGFADNGTRTWLSNAGPAFRLSEDNFWTLLGPRFLGTVV
jgi:hypothetical protein